MVSSKFVKHGVTSVVTFLMCFVLAEFIAFIIPAEAVVCVSGAKWTVAGFANCDFKCT